MAAEQRKCPYCGMSMSADQRSCPDCGNPYPFDDDAPPEPPTGPFRPQRADVSRGGSGGSAAGAAASAPPGGPRQPGKASGMLEAIAPYRTALVLATVLVLIVVVAYVLFSVLMSFFGERRPDPSTLPTPVAGPVLVPSFGASPVVGASPSPGTGTVISPAASPSPNASGGVKMKIARTENQGANMRQRPSTTAPVVKVLPEGTLVEVIGSDTNAEGRNWRNIRESGGQTGWVASDLLMAE